MQARSQTSLQAENRRLRAEIAALKQKRAPISVDPAEGRIVIDDYKTPDFTVDNLEVYSPAIKDAAAAMSKLDNWIDTGTKVQKPDFNQLLQDPMTVTDMSVQVPFKTINKTIPKIAGEQLTEAGMKNVKVSAGDDPGTVKITGRVKKLLEVGFEVEGDLSVTPAGKTRFAIERSRVAGLPMPNFITSLATAIFGGQSMEEMGVEQNGNEFLMDPKTMLPPNVDTKLSGIQVSQEGFLIQGGAPRPQNPA